MHLELCVGVVAANVHITQIMGNFTLLNILILSREYKGSIDTKTIARVMTIIGSISVIGLLCSGAVVFLEELLDGAEYTAECVAVQREKASF